MNPTLVSSILSTVAGPVTNMFSDMYRTNHEQTSLRGMRKNGGDESGVGIPLLFQVQRQL